MKTTAPVAALCGILLAASLPNTEAAQIISIDFNQTGTTATNAGSLGGNYNVTLRNNAGTATDLHSADGTGVSGLAGDRAFDLTTAVAMGGAGPYANFVSETNSDLAPLGALTLAGWYKVADGAELNSAYVIQNQNGSSPSVGGWRVNFTTVGRMQFTMGYGSAVQTVNSDSNAFSSNGGNWMFFAVSWNGSNATFYNGTVAGSATAVGSRALSQTMLGDTQVASIGRSNSTGALDGLLDDFKIYNTALDATQIEAVRVSAIPEPSTFAMLLAASFGALLFWRKRSARA